MTELINNFHFLRPWFLVLLIIPLFAYRHFFSNLKNISAWENVCDKKLLNFLLIRGSSQQRSFIGYLAIIGLFFAVLSLSGPTWQKKNMPSFAPENPVMILLNLSSDMENTDITPNRLARAKYGISDLVKELKTQTGLIVYTNEPFLISPITEDNNIIINLLPAIGRNIMPENGDKLNRAIDMAVERLKQGGYSKGNIVIFTADAGQEFNAALDSASKSFSDGYDVNVIAVRTSENEKLNLIASKGGGMILNIADNMNPLIDEINNQISAELKKTENEREVWKDNGYYLLFIPLFCALYFFRKGILTIVLWLVMTSTASAGFFTNANQDGAKAFSEGNYAQAADSFSNTKWKATAFYRQGDFENASKFFAKNTDVESMYNLGNALAKGGKIEEAIKKYEEVLKISPEHEDAKFNLEYLKQQQQEQQKNQDQSDKNNKEDKQDESSSSGSKKQQTEEGENSNNSGQGDKGEQQKTQENKEDKSGGESGENQQQNSDNSQDKKEQNNQQSSSPQAQNENNDEKQSSSSAAETPTPSPSDPQEKTDEEASAQGGYTQDDKGQFDEETQAREVAYRNIPEDAGGLLRAFIRKEYNKNRYGDK
ncbi:MAG: tetratricopeptide repeat protein [Alphaproteobacteria bacterium]|nr:tetratricopeptide repeat protein [Alphaproteobacteria bacterium]